MTAEHKVELSSGRVSMAGSVGDSAAAGVPRHWRLPLAAVVAAIAATLILLEDTVVSMVGTWSASNAFGHGFIVAPVSLYLVWLRRKELAKLRPRPALSGVLAVLACGLAWLLADLVSVEVVEQFALVAMLQAAVLSLLGPRVTWALALPLFFLYFAVPAGEALLPSMQTATAVMIVHVLRWLEIPVFLDGYYLTTPTGLFHVAEACAGLRYLISSLAVGTLFASLMYRSWLRRAAFIALSFAVPVFANGVRASMIVLLAHYSNGEIATGVDHFIYGWVFLSVVTVLLLLLGMALRERDVPAAVEERPVLGGRVVPASSRAVAITAAATILAIAAAPSARLWAQRDQPVGAGIELSLPSPSDPSWRAIPVEAFGWRPHAVGADARTAAAFERAGRRVLVDLAYYTHDRPGAEAISSANRLADEGWSETNHGRARIRADEAEIEVTTTYLRGRSRNLVAWQWYWVDGRFVGNPYVAKARQAIAALLGRDREAALVTVAAEYAPYDRPPAATLHEFIRDMGPLAPSLRRAAGSAP